MTDTKVMKAFLAGWFAHARNPSRLVVEQAWHVYSQTPKETPKMTETEMDGETHRCTDPECHVPAFVATVKLTRYNRSWSSDLTRDQGWKSERFSPDAHDE